MAYVLTRLQGSPILPRARDAPILAILRDSAPLIRGSPGYMEPPMRRNRGPPSQFRRLSQNSLSTNWKGETR